MRVYVRLKGDPHDELSEVSQARAAYQEASRSGLGVGFRINRDQAESGGCMDDELPLVTRRPT